MALFSDNKELAADFLQRIASVEDARESCRHAKANDSLTPLHLERRDQALENLGAFLNSLGNKKPRE